MKMFPAFNFAAAVAFAMPAGRLRADALLDAALDAGGPLAPVELQWRPALLSSPLPAWAPGPVEATVGSALFPIPARWRQPAIDRFVLTVVFDDTEDAGPVIEWRAPNGVVTRLSDGLGESPAALGLHTRSLILPDAITRDGGAVIVSMPWRPAGLASARIEPARDVTVAVTGASLQPGLVDRSGRVESADELEGREVPPLTGDLRDGPIVEAELAAAIEPLADELEFQVPVEGTVEGAVLNADVMGLEPDARIDLLVNGIPLGEMNPAVFRLDAPGVRIDSQGRLALAGWRHHSLFIPARAWLPGENRVVLRLRRPEAPAGTTPPAAFLKNAWLHLRFGNSGALERLDIEDVPWVPPSNTYTAAPPEPDLSSPLPLVDEPPEMPSVITIPPPVPSAADELPRVIVGPVEH